MQSSVRSRAIIPLLTRHDRDGSSSRLMAKAMAAPAATAKLRRPVYQLLRTDHRRSTLRQMPHHPKRKGK
eukprot:217111-Pleurochrysis_carterae.AAC.2